MSELHIGPNLTESQLQENYDYFINFLKQKFNGDRLQKLLNLYSEDRYGVQLTIAPASAKVNFHNAFNGGYLQHIFNVEKASRGVEKVFAAMGGGIDYTEEERVFAALHHDLGKLGDEDFGPYYEPNDSDWHIKNRGELFKHNDKCPPWNVTDRSLYILQKEGITLTWKEMLAIRLADGVFDKKNEAYYHSHQDFKTNLINVIHWADWMASRVEKCKWLETQ